jgi:hypothetical protein
MYYLALFVNEFGNILHQDLSVRLRSRSKKNVAYFLASEITVYFDQKWILLKLNSDLCSSRFMFIIFKDHKGCIRQKFELLILI